MENGTLRFSRHLFLAIKSCCRFLADPSAKLLGEFWRRCPKIFRFRRIPQSLEGSFLASCDLVDIFLNETFSFRSSGSMTSAWVFAESERLEI